MALPPTQRIKRRQKAPAATGIGFVEILKSALYQHDTPSHVDFLADMRAKQAAGKLANPATAELLDRLERSIR